MSERNRNNRQEPRRSSGLGLALWVAAALILFVLFLVNQGKIIQNLKVTGFFGRVFGKTPAFVENAAPEFIADTGKNEVAPVTPSQIEIEKVPAPAGSEKNSTAAVEEGTAGADGTETASTLPLSSQTVNLKLCFMSINSDGSVTRHEVTRAMKKTGSPLADAINALIDGPTVDEEREGCRTLVSTGTQLISATVKGGSAILNFSGEFEFNQYGIEGTRGQLQQIVYTATAFPTVENVQFLVDGEHREYLGGEGVWIGSPLSRNSF